MPRRYFPFLQKKIEFFITLSKRDRAVRLLPLLFTHFKPHSKMFLIEKYKTQQAQLFALEEREDALQREIAEIQKLRKEVVCEEISKAELIEEALTTAGFENFYFPNERNTGFRAWDDVKREVIIDGARVVVTLDLETQTLFFDGKILTPELV